MLPFWGASFALFRGEESATFIAWPEGMPDPNTHIHYYRHGIVLPWQECSFSWVPALGTGMGRWAEAVPDAGRLAGHIAFQSVILGIILLPRRRERAAGSGARPPISPHPLP